MLTQEENEFLCRVGPGTPMGNLFREYQIPVLLSEVRKRWPADSCQTAWRGSRGVSHP
jgi:hypothetical protein